MQIFGLVERSGPDRKAEALSATSLSGVPFPHMTRRTSVTSTPSTTADFLCTMELLELKRVNRDLSPNDLRFFNGTKEFTKTYFKKMREKRFAG